MIGLIVLFCVGFYLVIIFLISYLIAKFVKNRLNHNSTLGSFILGVIIFSFLFVLPVTDEIIGKIQLDNFCNKLDKIKISENKIRNKYLVKKYRANLDTKIKKTAVPISKYYIDYIDIETKELVFSATYYTMRGGWLSNIPLEGGMYPILYSDGERSCGNKLPNFKKFNTIIKNSFS